LTISALAQGEELYGSIGSQDIAAVLKDEGFSIDKNAIELPEPIKSLGIYELDVKLHPEVNAKIKLWVVKK
jgi:large subunit ribosomal protein L9